MKDPLDDGAVVETRKAVTGIAVMVIGIALLVPAIASAVLLILDVVLGRWQAIVGCTFTALVGLVTWYALPLTIRRAGHGRRPPHRAHRSPR